MGGCRERKRFTKERLVRLVPVGLIAGLVIHFSITLLYLTPPNPIKLRLTRLVHAYTFPFFEQSWSMFAPDLISDTRHLLVSCRLTDERGHIEETPWANMNAPYRALRHRYRLTPANRIFRAHMSPVHLLFNIDGTLVRKVLANEDQAPPEHEHAITLIEKSKEQRRELGERVMARLASAECDRLYGAGRTTDVRVRMVILKTPPFSKRHQPLDAKSARYTEFEWLPYEQVAPL